MGFGAAVSLDENDDHSQHKDGDHFHHDPAALEEAGGGGLVIDAVGAAVVRGMAVRGGLGETGGWPRRRGEVEL